MVNLSAARSGNLAAEFFAIWVDPTEYPHQMRAHRAFQLIERVREQIRRHPTDLALCRTPEDVLAARSAGRFGIVLALEGGEAIENDLALLRKFYQCGVRYLTLTWNHTTDWADSVADVGDPNVVHHNGVTAFGREVVLEMNRLGMMVDVSHSSDKTLADVLAISRAPVIASHSSARALTAAPRNLTDEQLRAIAAQRGAVMVNFFPAFIEEGWRQAWNALEEERRVVHRRVAAPYRAEGLPVPFSVSNLVDRSFAGRLPRPSLNCLLDHIMHIVQVAGEDHVGLGSDFDGIPATPEGIDSAADMPKITQGLYDRGLNAEQLHKLLGGNLLRVFQEVHDHALTDQVPTASSGSSQAGEP